MSELSIQSMIKVTKSMNLVFPFIIDPEAKLNQCPAKAAVSVWTKQVCELLQQDGKSPFRCWIH